MGVKTAGPTLEIQLIADVARLKRDLNDMKQAVAGATSSVSASFTKTGAVTAAAATQMATAAQASARASMGMASGVHAVGASANNARIAMLDMTHVGINLTQMLASGVNPMRALVQESGRLATAIQYSSGGIGGLIKQSAAWIGIIKITRDAQMEEAAALAAGNAQAVRSIAERAAATLQARQAQVLLVQAELAAADSAEAEAAAQGRLVKALRAVEVQAGKAAIANDAFAAANAEAAAASDAAAARSVTGIGRIGVALTGAALLAAPLIAAFMSAKSNAEGSDASLKRYIGTLGLTRKEIKKLKDEHVTWGDVASATWAVLLERAGFTAKGIGESFTSAFKWIGDFGKFTISLLLAGFAALVAVTASAAKNMVHFASGQYALMTDPLKDAKDQFFKTFADVNAGFDKISRGADALRDKRLALQAAEIKADRTPKKDKKQSDHGLAQALAELDAQIRGQLALAAAYQASDAEAIKAEALQKAEEQAIRHKGAVGLFYEKELALAIANRAAEAGKAIADIHAEAAARSVVNDLVEQGIVPVERMGQALEEQTKKRALMAALAVAEDENQAEQAAELRTEIANLAFAQGVLNEELAREAAIRQVASNADSIAKLQKEIGLIGATNRARAIGLAQLEAEQFIKKSNITDARLIADVTRSYVDQANATADLAEQQNNYNSSLTAMLDLLTLIEAQAQSVGQLLSDAFGGIGDSIGKALGLLASYQSSQQEIADWKRDEMKKAGTDAVQLANIEAQAQLKSKTVQLQAVGGLLEAGKHLFKEHSAGYKAMAAAERAFAIIQAINTIKYIAAGAAKMFAQLGVWAFPAVAAMVAIMAGLGFGGGSSTQKAPGIPDSGTGTVLGDPTAKSASIAAALDLMAKNSTKGLDYSADMARSLRGIESGIAGLAAAVASALFAKGSFFDPATLGLGTRSSGIQGLFGSKTTTSLYDQGIMLNAATIGQIMESGISGATYNVIEKVKKNSGFLGIGGSTKTSYSTQYGALDGGIASQFDAIIGEVYASVVDAAKILGLDVAAALKSFTVEIGQISFKDLTGDQITDQLNAIFSKIGDEMAGFAVAGLANFQKAGEGLFETLMRLAKDYLTVDAALKSIGMTFGAVGAGSIAARESLIALAGGLDALVDQVNFFTDHFLSDAQKTAFMQTQVDAAFQALGVSVPASIGDFADLVTGLDLSTDAGQQMFEALMAVAPAFYDVATAADQLAKKQQELQVQLYQALGNTAAATALQRQIALAALDPALADLQKQVWAAQDAAAAAAAATEIETKQAAALAAAKDNLSQAYSRETSALQQTVDKFRGFATALRDFRASLFATGGGGPGSYNGALIALIKQGGLAAGGDEGALGGGLQSSAQQFLDIATQNASTIQDVARARALVARTIDQGIGAADVQASIAEQQLDKMKDQVGQLIDLNGNVLSVVDAIDQLKELMFPASTPAPAAGGGTAIGGTPVPSTPGAGSGELLQEIRDHLAELRSSMGANATATKGIFSLFSNADRGGAFAMVTDDDAPLNVVSSA